VPNQFLRFDPGDATTVVTDNHSKKLTILPLTHRRWPIQAHHAKPDAAA